MHTWLLFVLSKHILPSKKQQLSIDGVYEAETGFFTLYKLATEVFMSIAITLKDPPEATEFAKAM